MKLTWSNQPLSQLKTDGLIIPLLADVAPARLRGFEPELARVITELNSQGDWRGEVNEVAMLYPQDFFGVKRIVLAGMGKQADWEYERLRQAVASAILAVKKRQLIHVTILLPAGTTPATARDLASIIILASYEFNHYKTCDESKKFRLEQVDIWTPDINEGATFKTAVSDGVVIGQATNFVRDLTNHPSNTMTPRHLASDAKELAGDGVAVNVFGRSELETMGMGALLAVAKGSAEEPQLIVVDYSPQRQRTVSREQKTDKVPTVALVGKGITFDSGGISIKPGDGMDEMKMDMAGAATALGVILAAKALAWPIRLIAVLPTTENLPSGSATKPGDIITAYNGTTIEIINTDAEGRVVLADGLAYAAQEFKPDALIDLATLTGAAIGALGHEATPIMGNNDQLLGAIEAAAQRTGERVWRLPLWDEYKEQVKSEIADVKNLGEGRQAGTIAGGAFLAYFVPKDIPWVHLDIAGTAILDKPRRPYLFKGGSGWGVRLLIDLLEHWSR